MFLHLKMPLLIKYKIRVTKYCMHLLPVNPSSHVVNSLVRYFILAIYVAKIDFIVFMASLGVK